MIHTRYKWTGIRFNESIITKSKSAQTTHNKNESVVIKQTTTKANNNILVQQTLCKSQLILIKLKWPIYGADKWIGQWFKATDHLKWSIWTERSGYVAKFIWVRRLMCVCTQNYYGWGHLLLLVSRYIWTIIWYTSVWTFFIHQPTFLSSFYLYGTNTNAIHYVNNIQLTTNHTLRPMDDSLRFWPSPLHLVNIVLALVLLLPEIRFVFYGFSTTGNRFMTIIFHTIGFSSINHISIIYARLSVYMKIGYF